MNQWLETWWAIQPLLATTEVAALKVWGEWAFVTTCLYWLSLHWFDLPWEDRLLMAMMAPWVLAYIVGMAWGMM